MHKYTYARNIAQLYQNFNCRKYDGFGNRIDDTEKGSAGWSPPLDRVFTPNTRTEYITVAHEMDTVSSLWFDSKWCIIQTLSSVGPKTTFKRSLPVRSRLQLNFCYSILTFFSRGCNGSFIFQIQKSLFSSSQTLHNSSMSVLPISSLIYNPSFHIY